ncbi:MAG TPA: glycosyltransferase family 9 protein [Ornithinicoccus sp.]|nr:glycosyltransferase family 9 protein [Ornithinicoccus sp.]
MSRLLAVRLDSDGDVLLTGPAIRALAASGTTVDLLAAPSGEAAARLLPGVSQVLTYDAPWSGFRPPPVDDDAVEHLVSTLRSREYAAAVIFTSFHQSPLPMALLCKVAGIPHVAATSEDYPGSLLDLRHRRPEGLHEVEAMLDLARATGARLPDGDSGRLALRTPLPDVSGLTPPGEYVVLHPGASVPSRATTVEHATALCDVLTAAGWQVVLTGGPSEAEYATAAQRGGATDLVGRTTLAMLAAVLADAACVVVGNTGPAHLAAAVGTPVVSLFAPVVPASRWAPYGIPSVVLGDQQAPCRDTRARECPVGGHPCLTGISPESVVAAVQQLVGVRA